MKKLLSLAACCALAQAGYAQTSIKAGTVQLGGSINYSHTHQSNPYYYYSPTFPSSPLTADITNNQFSVNPSVGYFVADNLALGLSGTYTANTTSTTYSPSGPIYTTPSDYTTRQFLIGPFVQYYRMLTEQFGVVGTLTAGYQRQKQSGGEAGNGFFGGLTPSIVFFPVPKLGLGASVGSIGYNQLDFKAEYGNIKTNNSTFGANFGLDQLAFSGTYYFGR